MSMSKAENDYKPKTLPNLHSLTTPVMGWADPGKKLVLLPLNVRASVGQGGGAASGGACHQAPT